MSYVGGNKATSFKVITFKILSFVQLSDFESSWRKIIF
jgi:hypothetical protein